MWYTAGLCVGHQQIQQIWAKSNGKTSLSGPNNKIKMNCVLRWMQDIAMCEHEPMCWRSVKLTLAKIADKFKTIAHAKPSQKKTPVAFTRIHLLDSFLGGKSHFVLFCFQDAFQKNGRIAFASMHRCNQPKLMARSVKISVVAVFFSLKNKVALHLPIDYQNSEEFSCRVLSLFVVLLKLRLWIEISKNFEIEREREW